MGATKIVIHAMKSIYGALSPQREKRIKRSEHFYKTIKAKARSERTPLQKLADFITRVAGSISFALFHLVWFSLWLAVNTGLWPVIEPFDPYPFGFLTLVVSLEAIFLSIFVLMSQNREAQITDLREELDFQITLHAEQEVTKLISMVEKIHKAMGIDDEDLSEMEEEIDLEKLKEELKDEF